MKRSSLHRSGPSDWERHRRSETRRGVPRPSAPTSIPLRTSEGRYRRPRFFLWLVEKGGGLREARLPTKPRPAHCPGESSERGSAVRPQSHANRTGLWHRARSHHRWERFACIRRPTTVRRFRNRFRTRHRSLWSDQDPEEPVSQGPSCRRALP